MTGEADAGEPQSSGVRRGAWGAALVVFFLLGPGCREESPGSSPEPDAGPAALEIHRADLGLRFALPAAVWRTVPDPTPPTVVALRRSSSAAVAPRIEVTREAAGTGPAAAVFARVLADLRRIDDRPEVTLERSGFALRSVGSADAAEIRLLYRLDDPEIRIRHLSLAVLPPAPVAPGSTEVPEIRAVPRGAADAAPQSRSLVTLTATWLDTDSATVEPELEHAFRRIEVFSPVPSIGDAP